MASGELTDAEVFGSGKRREWTDAEVFNASRPALLNQNLARQGVAIEGAREGIRNATEFMSSRDSGIDYKTGVTNAAFRAGFSRMSNDAEKENFLNRSIGKGNWEKDSFGAFVLNPEGLKRLGIKSAVPVAMDEQRTTKYDVADVAGDLPAVAGGIGGGMAASGLGVIPGLGMAALGAAGGKALDEIVKNFQGLQVKTPGEVATAIGGEAAMAATGEGVGRALAPAARFALGPGASRMTPEKKALADEAMAQGFRIRPGSVTDAPILARWEGMVRSIFGDMNAQTNKAAAQSGVERLGIAGGKPISKEDAGIGLSASLRAQRVNFGQRMSQQYAKVDEIVGNSPFVPTAPLKEQAQALLANLPKTADGKVVGGKDAFLRDLIGMGDAMTVTQAQRLRTMLREASESPDLVPDIAMHEARVLKKSVEEAFEQAKNTPSSSGRGAAAIGQLRLADEAYKQGIRQFDNRVVTAITKDAGKPGGVDPDMVVDYLIKPEHVVRLRYVKNVASPQAWERVKSAHAQDLLGSVVRGTDDPLAKIFDGRSFRDTLEKYGRNVLEEVHGKQWVDDAYKYAGALMLAEKRMKLSGGIVAANVALHPIENMPKLLWLRGLAKVMEQPGTFKYLTEGITLGPNTKAGYAAITRVMAQAAANARDETGSASVTLTAPQSPQQ